MEEATATHSPGDGGIRAFAALRPGFLSWIGLAACGVLLVVLRLHAFELPLETDECNYAYMGARLLGGDRLYVDVWDHQPPGVFVLIAGIIALFGDAPSVFRWTATAFSLVSCVLIFAILRRLTGPAAAIMGALLFAICSSDPGTAGEGCNREIYMATLILGAWYCALRGSAPRARGDATGATRGLSQNSSAQAEACGTGRDVTGKAGWVFAAGCALGVASSIKTIVAVHWLALGLWIAVDAWRGSRTGGRGAAVDRDVAQAEACGSGWRVARSLAVFAAGPLILWVGIFGYFALTGRLAEFVDAVFVFNLSYSGGSENFASRFVQFFAPQRHPYIFQSAWPLWIGAVGASVWLIVATIGRKDRDALAILLLVLASYVAVCLPGRFWPHYYYLLIPSVIPAIALAARRIATRLSGFARAPARGWSKAGGLVYAVFPMWLMFTEYRHYVSQPLFGLTVKRYNSRDFWGRAQGENVRRVTDPQDEIFVFGNEAEIYYYSGRRCASRFTMITGLHSLHSGADRRRETLLRELRSRLPRLILVLFDEPPFEAWQAFLEEHYGEPIGWDFHDRTGEPIMFVLARKDHPVESINWDWDRSAVGGWMLGER